MIESTLSCSEIRERYMKSYNENKEEIDKYISEGIEQNRKGDCVLKIIDQNGNQVNGVNFKLTQKGHDFKHGANMLMLDEFKEEKYNVEYRRFFKEYFNLGTVPFYWNALEPEEGKLRFASDSEKIYRRPPTDLCVEYCEENGIWPKLHCLFYDKFAPDWIKNLPREEAEKKFETRVKQIAERYKGRMYEFEVTNELLCTWDKQTEMFFRKDVVNWAFDIANKYLPGETLVINETFPVHTMAGAKERTPYYMLIENALLKGAKIDKIGIQNHLFTGVSAHTVEQYDKSVKSGVNLNNMKSCIEGLRVLSGFGLPIEITEVTVPTFGPTEEHEELQADMLKLWYSVFFATPLINEVVYWNTVDGHAYTGNPNWIENNCNGGLFHKDLTPKKSGLMIKKLFSEIWHTDLEGSVSGSEIDFRGFYGEYEVEINGKTYGFGLHKDSENIIEIKI